MDSALVYNYNFHALNGFMKFAKGVQWSEIDFNGHIKRLMVFVSF